jgi:hypothetical protein
VLIFGALFGVIGAIVGVPIAAAVQTSSRRPPPRAERASRRMTSRGSGPYLLPSQARLVPIFVPGLE